ncbi:elongation factor P hydroxylase [Aliikangiella sp. G2MR2-5]|uniref:elongation factor P hydroxylase n=1 Tax=Aliikangiella sp. G2MR2-5 TaxID=2788943 RepID=UPI0018A95DAD|nr:elongation factor P hydroxylase [Aliikangiella sp. G2MR2-5]
MLNEVNKLNTLVEIFNKLFQNTENTVLQPGADEPFYQAPSNNKGAVIYSREDYFSSALHEIAHWCIAGNERRKIDDFGYWYKPEGRSIEEQLAFEQVEVKPQAIEWAFHMACDHPFHFSADNLSQAIEASDSFKLNVSNQLNIYLANGLPRRGQILFEALNSYFCAGREVSTMQVNANV